MFRLLQWYYRKLYLFNKKIVSNGIVQQLKLNKYLKLANLCPLIISK
jgi:hypothetical protein